MIRKLLIASLFALSFASWARAVDSPATRPTEEPPIYRPQRGMGGPGGPGGMGGRGWQDRELSPDEIERAKAFAKENFPNRYAVYESLLDPSMLRRIATRRMVNQWHRLINLRDQQPEMFEAMMREQKAMDEAFGLWRDVQNGKPGAEEKLNAKLIEIVENQLDERKARIEKLEKVLQEQKEQLSRDRERKDALVEQRREQLDRDTRLPRDRDDKNEPADTREAKPK